MQKVDRLSGGSVALAFSRDGKQIAWGFDVPPDGKMATIPFTFGTGRLRSVGPAQVRLLTSSDGTEIRRISLPDGFLNDIAFSPDGTRLVTSTGGGTRLTFWDARTGKQLLEAEGLKPQTIVKSLVYSNDGTRLAGIVGEPALGGKQDVVVWDAASGKKLFTLKGHAGYFVNVAFSPDGKRLATVTDRVTEKGLLPVDGAGNELKLWDAATGNELMTLKDLGRNTARYLAFDLDGTRLYAVGTITPSRTTIEIRIWDATPRQP